MTNNPTAPPEEIFKEDEFSMTKVNASWTLNQLLEQPGLFFFKDIRDLMNLSSARAGQIARHLREQDRDPWTTCGLRKLWSHWVVKMTLFAPYYHTLNIPNIKRVDPSWDGNSLIRQKGIFLLTDVCKKIPFSPYQLRYRARTNPNAREEYGIWKEEAAFLVLMDTFGPWLKSIWLEGKKSKPKASKKAKSTKVGKRKYRPKR